MRINLDKEKLTETTTNLVKKTVDTGKKVASGTKRALKTQ